MKVDNAADKPTMRKIIDAAIPLFATRGIAGVSVKEIADAAGVNIALISYYFGGKESLYVLILKRHLELWEGLIAGISQADLTPTGKIKRFVVAAVDLHNRHPYLDRLFLSELINPTKYFEKAVSPPALRMRQLFQEWIEAGIARGEFRSDLDPYSAAVALNNLIHFYFVTSKIADSPKNDGDQATHYFQQVVSIYLQGVLVPQQ
jgi:AcrR family transcriptional regulator